MNRVKSLAVANAFLSVAEKEGKKINPMKLFKLIYYAHGWHLAFHGEPLLNECIEAWRYGPVIPSVHREFKEYGNRIISEKAKCDYVLPSDSDAYKTVERVWYFYKEWSAIQLANSTHTDDGPWAATINNIGGADKLLRGQNIDNEIIKSFFLNEIRELIKLTEKRNTCCNCGCVNDKSKQEADGTPAPPVVWIDTGM